MKSELELDHSNKDDISIESLYFSIKDDEKEALNNLIDDKVFENELKHLQSDG